MSNGYFKAAVPHLMAAALFLILACAYYAPVLQGKVLRQSDNIQALGMQKEINDIRGKGEAHPLWTNSMFGGMPVYQIHLPGGNNLTAYLGKVLMLGGGVSSPLFTMFLMMAMFYILMMAMGVDWKLGIIGAIAYGLATNHIVLTEAGHSTKIVTMAYLPAMLAGVLLIFKRKYLLGGVLTALFFSLQLLANHIQITLYFFITLFVLGLFEAVRASKENAIPAFGKSVAVLLVAGLIGFGANIARVWTTYEYTDETIRGKSEITVAGKFIQNSSSDKESGEGLSKDYIFGWSYGVGETFTVLIPDYMGRASGTFIVDNKGQLRDTESAKSFQRDVAPKLGSLNQQQQGQMQQALVRAANPYRGDVQFTSGPIYFGAVICFLFVLGFFTVNNSLKWWFLSATIILMMISWGRNFSALNYFLVDHVPMFNKLRAVMMALGIGQLFVTAFGIWGVKELVSRKDFAVGEKSKAILMAAGMTGGLSLLLWLAASMGFIDFSSPKDDANLLGNYPNFWNAIKADRMAMMQSDALRSFMFIALAAAALWAYATDKLKWGLVLPVLGALVLLDFWLVDQRFLSADDFQTKQEVNQTIQPTKIDTEIMNDPDPYFRVVDYTKGYPYTSAQASYFHKSMGGYHAAKLMRFQDLCEHYLFGGNPTDYQHILGMLNTKYMIYENQGQAFKVLNSEVLGNAWFVKDYELVENADAEIQGLATLEPRTKALIDKKFASYVEGLALDTIIPGDYIKLTKYHPDHMEYEVKSNTEQLAMFSEMYYPPSKGWNMYIDGKKQDLAFIKANYAIRAARLPAGEYKIAMKFEPKSFYTGRMIGLVCSLLIIGGLAFMAYRSYVDYVPSVPAPEEPKVKTAKAAGNTERKPAPKRRKK